VLIWKGKEVKITQKDLKRRREKSDIPDITTYDIATAAKII
jgi:hypothetical protein